jgi:hypothetical protein
MQAALGALLLAALLLTPRRAATESSMTMHMLVQFPVLLLAGGLLAAGLPPGWMRWLAGWNELGIAGLVGAALVLAVAMVPRLLDLALVDGRVESVKLLALVLTGGALRLSWRPAGTVVQAFLLGNVLPMMAVVGILFQDATSRLCNAYRLDDQQFLGLALAWLAPAIFAGWLLTLAMPRMALFPRASFAASGDRSSSE